MAWSGTHCLRLISPCNESASRPYPARAYTSYPLIKVAKTVAGVCRLSGELSSSIWHLKRSALWTLNGSCPPVILTRWPGSRTRRISTSRTRSLSRCSWLCPLRLCCSWPVIPGGLHCAWSFCGLRWTSRCCRRGIARRLRTFPYRLSPWACPK